MARKFSIVGPRCWLLITSDWVQENYSVKDWNHILH